MAKFEESRPWNPPAQINFKEAKKERPEFIGPAIYAVIGLSLGAGLLAFVGLGLLSLGAGWSVKVALVGSGLAIIGAGVIWSLDAKSIMFSVETIVGHDLNGDGAVGTPQKATISLLISEPVYNRSTEFELPGTPEQFGRLVRGVNMGRPLAETHWTGRGKPYSKAEFAQLCEALENRGIVQWRDEKAKSQGRELTRAGRAVFKALADAPEIARTHAQASNGGPLLPSGEEE